MSVKIDLHTHSYASPDGGLTIEHYRHVLENGLLDFIAITDHGVIDGAVCIKEKLGEFSEHIIVGEEIKTIDGEIIGLFLTDAIDEGLTPKETVTQIKKQNGLVYIPHPFETVRSGISVAGLESIIDDVDIIETYNGRAVFQDKGRAAVEATIKHNKSQAVSSDAHGRVGWPVTYSMIAEKPTKTNLVPLLKAADYSRKRVGLGILYPKFNRLMKKLKQS